MNYSSFLSNLEKTPLKPWLTHLSGQIEQGFDEARWGDLPDWRDALNELPDIKPSSINLNSSAIRIGTKEDCDDEVRHQLQKTLMKFHPWRKGPFELFGVEIDTEWRSDLKWNRVKDQIASLEDRLVLDVGCGSGYHCWRMEGAGARLVMGIDPTVLYPMQYGVMQKYIQSDTTAVLPIGIDDVPQDLAMFDTVFSMGLLYHRRAPFDHLLQLQSLLRDGGELVLETLVIDGEMGDVLSPAGRYAKMPNVWFIPSVPTLEQWLRRLQFKNVRCIDVCATTSEEQRVTKWMGFQSLADFLDPADLTKTVEGYPAPKRAVILADKKP